MTVIEFFLVGGVALVAQGVYTLTTGDIRLLGFLMRPSISGKRTKRSNRVISGLFYLACGLWVLHVPVLASLRSLSLGHWVSGHSGLLLVVVFCSGLGIFLLAWPGTFLEWLRSSYPQIPATEPWALMIPRGIGVGALVIAIQLFAEILYNARFIASP